MFYIEKKSISVDKTGNNLINSRSSSAKKILPKISNN
jgi:hypothetical protein